MAKDMRSTGSEEEIVTKAKKGDMPSLRAKRVVPIACLLSDIHLSLEAPISRAEKGKEWLDVQARYLDRVTELVSVNNCPVVIAGDIFHKWDAPAELINFAIKHIPEGSYAIPGNHDLPNHNYEDIKRSAYWTLVKARVIEDLLPGFPVQHGKGFFIHGFPCGTEVVPFEKINKEWDNDYGCTLEGINLAVIHDYCWSTGHSFPGCPEDKHCDVWAEKLEGYTAALFGDNHKSFISRRGEFILYNHGGLIPRNSDEKDATPTIGWLLSNGTILSAEPFREIENKWVDRDDEIVAGQDEGIAEFVATLDDMSELFFNFGKAVNHWIDKNKIAPDVKKALLKALAGEKA